MTFCLYRTQQVQYRLHWRGFVRRSDSWVNADRCDCHYLIAQYHIRMRAELENRLREMTNARNILQVRVQTLTGPITRSAARLLQSCRPSMARAPALVQSSIEVVSLPPTNSISPTDPGPSTNSMPSTDPGPSSNSNSPIDRGPPPKSKRTTDPGPSTSSVRTTDSGPSTSSMRTTDSGPPKNSNLPADPKPPTGKQRKQHHQTKKSCKRKKVQCAICGLVLNKQYALDRHRRNIHRSKDFSCAYCMLEFRFKTHIAKHFKDQCWK